MSKPSLTPRSGGLCVTESALRPADIIVSTTTAKNSGIIRFATGSEISHAALYLGRGRIIEALSSGVEEKTLAKALEDDSVAVAYRHRAITSGLAARVVAAARELKGRKYDTSGAIAAGPASWHPLTCIIALGIVGCAGVRRGAFNSSDRFYCSELILEAFSRAGLPITNNPPGGGTPQGLVEAHSQGKLAYVGHLVTD